MLTAIYTKDLSLMARADVDVAFPVMCQGEGESFLGIEDHACSRSEV